MDRMHGGHAIALLKLLLLRDFTCKCQQEYAYFNTRHGFMEYLTDYSSRTNVCGVCLLDLASKCVLLVTIYGLVLLYGDITFNG